MLAATGKYRLFTDADGSTPISEFHGLRTALERSGGSGVAFGSIGLRGALVEQPQSGLRSTLGKFGNLMIRVLALPGVHDSQQSFKLFSADAAEAVFRRSVVDGWGFDVEALALARRLGFGTTEVPVRWAHVEGGTLTPAAYLTTLGDVARVRWRLMVGSNDLSLNAAETVASPRVWCHPRTTSGQCRPHSSSTTTTMRQPAASRPVESGTGDDPNPAVARSAAARTSGGASTSPTVGAARTSASGGIAGDGRSITPVDPPTPTSTSTVTALTVVRDRSSAEDPASIRKATETRYRDGASGTTR